MNKIINMNRVGGFTLIELMIVVAVIGIIASIALPSYQDSIRKTNRADAKVSLMSKAAELERCFTMNGSYLSTASKPCAAVTTGGALAVTTTEKGKYTLEATALTAVAFTLTATPVSADLKCNIFTLQNTGVKTVNGSDGNTKCWN